MQRTARSYLFDEGAASGVEYCLVASLIALYVVGALGYLGINLRSAAVGIVDMIAEAGR
jgi:Flp pilus assembly pilin Flp